MYVSFENLPDSARIWIYQTSRKITESEVKAISDSLMSFTNQWAAHGNPLRSSFKIEHNLFIVIGVDEGYNDASGCSIDSSTHVFKKLEHELGISFFGRTDVAFFKDATIELVPMKNLTQALQSGTWNAETLVFNNMILSKGDMKNWSIPAKESWLKRYLTKETAF